MKTRIQFDFDNEAIVRLDNLVRISHAASRAELLRKALALYEHMKTKAHDGYTVELKKDGEESVILPMGLI